MHAQPVKPSTNQATRPVVSEFEITINRNSWQNIGCVYKTKKPMLSMWRDESSDQAVQEKL